MQLGCEPTEDQHIDFSVSNVQLASVNPVYSSTDSDGNISATLIAGNEEGVVLVMASTTVLYYSYSIYASAGGKEEIAKGPLSIENLNQSVEIQIEKSDEIWSGTMVANCYLPGVVTENANYDIDFQFLVTPSSDSSECYAFYGPLDDITITDPAILLSDGSYTGSYTFVDLNIS